MYAATRRLALVLLMFSFPAPGLLAGQLSALNARQMQLVAQGREAEARYQREFGRVQDLRAALDRVRAAKGRAETQPATTTDPKVRSQKQRSTALTTHVPLPVSLEQERKRVLEAFTSSQTP